MARREKFILPSDSRHLQIQGRTTPDKILGIPFKSRRLNRSDWESLFDMFEKKLESWKGSLLSLGGRWSYLMRFSLPSPYALCPSLCYHDGVKWRIDRIKKRFLWNRTADITNRYHLVPSRVGL